MTYSWTSTLWYDDIEPVNHNTRNQDHLIWQYQGKPREEAILSVLSTEVQNIESVAFDVFVGRSVYTAVGAQLDIMGKIVGQERGALIDSEYRVFIIGRIFVNRSNGTIPELYELLSKLGITERIYVDTYAPAIIRIDATGCTHGKIIGLLVRDFHGGGIQTQWNWSDESVGDSFALSSNVDSDEVSVDGGTCNDLFTIGGQLAGTLPEFSLFDPGALGEIYNEYALQFTPPGVLSMGNVLNKLHTDAFSAGFWAQTTTAGAQVPFGKEIAVAPFTGWIFYMNGGTNTLTMYLINAGGANFIAKNFTIATMDDGNYHCYMFTYDGGSLGAGVRLYYDAAEVIGVTTTDTLSATLSSAADMMVGARGVSGVPADNFTGYVDEASQWNKELTLAEYLEVFHGGSPINLYSHSAAANLEFWSRQGDDDTYPTITDRGFGGNNGTMINMAPTDIVTVVP